MLGPPLTRSLTDSFSSHPSPHLYYCERLLSMALEVDDTSTRSGAAGSREAAPPRKRGRPPKVQRDSGTANGPEAVAIASTSTSKKATSRKLKPPPPPGSLEEETRPVSVNNLEEESPVEGGIDVLPMDLDEGEEESVIRTNDTGEGSGSSRNQSSNLFDQNNGAQDSVESLPDTSMLVESTSQKVNWRRKDRNSSSAIDASLVTAIAKEVEKLKAGSFQSIADGKRPQYKPHSNDPQNSCPCYMGPIQGQVLQSVAIDSSKPLAKLVDDAKKPGALFNVGGHVYSVDWLFTEADEVQYLCVSASLQEHPRTVFGDRLVSEKKPARVQIWSIDEEFEAELQINLCFDQGWISSVRWVPMSTTYDKSTSILGLLSACMQDGSVGIYAVPRPSTLPRHHMHKGAYIKVEPILQLNIKKGVPTAMEWHKADKVAVAYSHGWVSVWNLLSCLEAGSAHARPLIFARVSTSPITSLAWNSDGEQIYASSFDGSMRCLQLAFPQFSTTIYHSRDVSYSVVFSQTMGFPLMERPEADDVRSVEFSAGKSQTTTLYSHLGRIRTMSVSPHHSHMASGSVDGTVRVVDLELFLTRSGKKGRKASKLNIILPIYRLDKNRGAPALRFIENLAPQSTAQQVAHSSAAWDPQISLTVVKWNCNEEKQSWLASATACGLLRVDVVDM